MTTKKSDEQLLEEALERSQGSWVNAPVRESKTKDGRKKRNWFAFDDEGYEQLDEFDSNFWYKPKREASTDYLDRMWGRHGWGSTKSSSGIIVDERDTKVAHGMIQGFLNSFSRDGHYVMSFDDTMSAAGTNMKTKIVKVTPSPLLDDTITATDAGHILTALVLHEISHPRYGFNTAEAVERIFGRSVIARQVSNVLDDVRIERRFEDDYPGYTGIFDPLKKYVGDAMVKRNGGKKHQPELADQYNICVGAIRFPDHNEWTAETLPEKEWWQGWAERHAHEDSPKRHVAAVREALEHIVEVKDRIDASKPPKVDLPAGTQPGDEPDEDRSDDDSEAAQGADGSNVGDPAPFSLDDLETEDDEEDEPDEDTTAASVAASKGHEYDRDTPRQTVDDLTWDESQEQIESDLDLGKAADEDRPDTAPQPSCVGTASVDNAAQESGVKPGDIEQAESDAQDIVEASLFSEDDGNGNTVDVVRSIRGLQVMRVNQLQPSGLAARYVSDAFLSSRTGHTETEHFKRRGRLDERALHRIATRDFRLFDKKTRQSPGKYLVWVMVDKSSSMDGWPTIQAAQIAHALAAGSESVPSMRLEVWAWSWPFRGRGFGSGPANHGGANAGVARVWRDGEPMRQIEEMQGLYSGGTPDSVCMSWAAHAIKRELRGSEKPIIVFCSDGDGDKSGMDTRVAEARRSGVIVVGVALGQMVGQQVLERRFGHGYYVPWQGSIVATAKPLAKMLARIVSK